jgi:acetoacetate decarboxylase
MPDTGDPERVVSFLKALQRGEFGLLNPTPFKRNHLVDYGRPTFTDPYREAGLMLHVRTLAGRGWHCCWMVLDDDDTAMIYGREILGYPKKRASIRWEETDDAVHASVTRRGVEILSLEAVKGVHEANPAPIFDVKTFNVGGIGNFLAFNTAWCFRITETFRESRAAEVDVTLRPAEDDPIAVLAASQKLRAAGRFASTDITGLRYLFPVGIAGPRWFTNTYFLRFR